MTETRAPFNGKKKEPIGVFVRLPISENDAFSIHAALQIPAHTTTLLGHALCKIGVPVQACELYPVGYISEDAIGGIAVGIYQSASIFRDDDAEHHDSVALVRMTHAASLIAERDAKIAHLQDNLSRTLEIAMRRADGTTCTHLVKQAFSLAKTTEMTADEVVQAVLGDLFPVLKGPEA